MLTDDQKLARLDSLGGSDIACLLNLSKYKTPYELYLEKRGALEPSNEETAAQYWGSTLEAVIRSEFVKRHNVEVIQPEQFVHPEYPFLKGSVDGFIPSENAVLEIKTSSAWRLDEWGDDGSDKIPFEYICQVAFYCILSNASYATIAVLIGGNDYREYRYERSKAVEAHIIRAAIEFWRCVKAGIPPEPVSMGDIKLLYPQSEEVKVQSDINIDEKIMEYQYIKKTIAQLEEKKEKLKIEITHYMKFADTLINVDGEKLATYKSNKNGNRVFNVREDK